MLRLVTRSSFFRGFVNTSLATLYPAECAMCGEAADSYEHLPCCQNCWEQASFAEENNCARCDFPVFGQPIPQTSCASCVGLHFAFARTTGIYDGALRASILRLKSVPLPGRELQRRLVNAFERLPIKPDLIIAPPLHPARFRERGFNQAELLAEELALETGTRTSFSLLTKVANTGRHRAAQDRKDRLDSLQEAFKVRAPKLAEGRSILIVDDLMTTGATADALSRKLLAAGASSVSVLTIARASGFFVD